MMQRKSMRPSLKLVLLPLLLLVPLVLRRTTPSCSRPLLRFSDVKPLAVYDTIALCHANPYLTALQESASQIASHMDEWLQDIGQQAFRSDPDSVSRHDHARFSPFSVMATCHDKTCVGGPCGKDTSKTVCGLTQLQERTHTNTKESSCIVYSIGGNNHWEFELDLLQQTSCHVHTFDCTGQIGRFEVPSNSEGRLHFHHVCLGTVHEDAATKCAHRAKCGETWTLLEMQQRLGHDRIDILKMDIEGFEWTLLESWPTLSDTASMKMVVPMQILMEVHYRTQFASLRPPLINRNDDFRYFRDIVNLEAHLLRMGYVVVERDDNAYCSHCTELTLVRVKCHNVTTVVSV